MIKDDEIQIIKIILTYCHKKYDVIPIEEIEKLNINYKRVDYLLHKMSHFIEYGVSIYHGWICEDPSYIQNYYKNVHNINI